MGRLFFVASKMKLLIYGLYLLMLRGLPFQDRPLYVIVPRATYRMTYILA
jgi:hypothetical protein